jgi:hypothetical protein
MAAELPAVQTVITGQQLREGLCAAWSELYGEEPSQASIALLCAQSAFETAFWKRCMAFNLEGAKAMPGGGYDWCYFTTTEWMSPAMARSTAALASTEHPAELVTTVPDGRGLVEVKFKPKHPACCFRAFETLEAACVDYLRLLAKKFSSAWPAVLAGDVATFIQEIKAHGYFTGDPAVYLAGVRRCYGAIVCVWLGFPNIVAYQKARGLTTDGMGPITLEAMRQELIAGTAPSAA